MAVQRPGEKGDLILREAKWPSYGNASNVPRRFQLSGFVHWGYEGAGPHDLALNVLYHYSDQNEDFARRCAGAFVEEVVRKLPMGRTMRIDGTFLNAWVSERLSAFDPAAERPIPGQLSPIHLAWDNEFKLVLAPAEIP